jgi:hypothetical protein
MKKRSTTLLLTFAAVTLLAAGTQIASARRIAVSVQTLRSVWSSMEFNLNGLTTVRCPVTLEGSFASRTISKVFGTLIARYNRGIFGEASCVSGSARVLAETIPWHEKWATFTGTLPNITMWGWRWPDWRFLTRVLEISCLYTTSETEPVIAESHREAGGRATGVSVSGSIRSSTAFCPSVAVAGTSANLTSAAGEPVTISLVQ